MELRSFWFALTVKPRHEKAAAHNLRLRGLEEFLPLHAERRPWSDRVKTVELPLFPGYVFCRFTYAERLWALNTPGIRSIVGFGNQETPLADAEVEAVQKLVSSGMPISPWPYLRIGDRVQVEHGALEGVRGVIVREKGPWRLVVNVELLQRSIAVEIDREFLGPCRGLPSTSTCQQQLSC